MRAKITVHANKQDYSFLANSPYGMNKELFNELKCFSPVFEISFSVCIKIKIKINHNVKLTLTAISIMDRKTMLNFSPILSTVTPTGNPHTGAGSL